MNKSTIISCMLVAWCQLKIVSSLRSICPIIQYYYASPSIILTMIGGHLNKRYQKIYYNTTTPIFRRKSDMRIISLILKWGVLNIRNPTSWTRFHVSTRTPKQLLRDHFKNQLSFYKNPSTSFYLKIIFIIFIALIFRKVHLWHHNDLQVWIILYKKICKLLYFFSI